jgi:hypothetical protein
VSGRPTKSLSVASNSCLLKTVLPTTSNRSTFIIPGMLGNSAGCAGAPTAGGKSCSASGKGAGGAGYGRGGRFRGSGLPMANSCLFSPRFGN